MFVHTVPGMLMELLAKKKKCITMNNNNMTFYLFWQTQESLVPICLKIKKAQAEGKMLSCASWNFSAEISC